MHVRETLIAAILLNMTRIALPLLFLPLVATGQDKTVTYYADPAATPPDLPVKIRHLDAFVRFEPEHNRVVAAATFTFTPNRFPVDSFAFHAPGFVVDSLQVNGRAARFHMAGDKLVIFPGDLLHARTYGDRTGAKAESVRIVYRAEPSSGMIYFVGWKPEETGKRKQIWAHRPHGWLPYMDGRITADLHVTFDSNYRVFSNGERVAVDAGPGGTKTWHYAMKKDHPFFSTALVIGDYSYKAAKTSRGTPLEFWYYSDMPDRVGTTYMYTERMFEYFEKELGFNYPYPVYRQAPVIDYMYGAMETTTSTVFGDYMQITPRSWWQRNYVNVNAHELAHQWFGNCVAHYVNRDVWLTESFGTYYAKMFEKYIFGEDYYQNVRNEELRLTFEAAERNAFPVGGSQGGVQRIYQKGSLVLDMLRDVMGDEAFREAVKLYLEQYAFDYAQTSDFIRCTYEASGESHEWFFDEWILRGGEPWYHVSDTVVADAAGLTSTLFRIRQMQPVTPLNGLFRMPVNFEVHYTDGTSARVKELVEKEYTEVKIANPGRKEIAYTLFDPGRKVLKKLDYPRTFSRLAAQAASAGNMIDRYDAWLALRGEPYDRKWEMMAVSFARETFWLSRAEILYQANGENTPETVELFRLALRDRDAQVRKAALLLLDPVPDLLRSAVEECLYDSSYVNVEFALENLCMSFPADADHYLDLTRDMEGWRGKNIRMMWLEIALHFGKTEYLTEVIGYCGPAYEFETRMNAFGILGRMKYSDKQTLADAEQASKHWNNKLAGAAREYLKGVKK